jgi:cystathionine beta-lyase
MSYNFDQVHPRRNSDSIKWNAYPEDVLPLWVADMDFPSPAPVLEALQQRVAAGIFGYGSVAKELTEVLCERLQQRYQWTVTPEQLIFLPNLVSGLNLVCRAFAKAGEAALVQTPIYPPFLSAPMNQGIKLQSLELIPQQRGAQLYYEIDELGFTASMTPETRLFLLCNPHNPVGRHFSRSELESLATLCLQNDLIICSDEVHCDLNLDGQSHIPFATLSPDIAQRCITLLAPSKTFNIAGLGGSFAVVENPQLRKQLLVVMEGLIPHLNVLNSAAMLAAYQHGESWRQALIPYLRGNRDFLVNYLATHLPQLKTTIPEATYLAWIDCRDANLHDPYQFFLKQAKVAFNEGNSFGQGGAGFVRLNFGCPRSTLEMALERMRHVLGQVIK